MNSLSPASSVKRPKSRVLIVDDERNIRVSLRAFLDDQGYEVEIAEDADQALALLSTGPWDVVVTDIALPKLSGIDLLKAIRTASPNVQVIMMTGDPTVETAAAAVRAGASDYLTKPIAKNAILRSVSHAAQIKALDEERRGEQDAKERYQHQLQAVNETLEAKVQERTASLLTEMATRKQSEVSLSVSEVRYRRLFESAQDGILILDAETGMVVDVNPYLIALLGFPYEEFLGKKVWELGFLKDIVAGQANFAELQQKEYVRYADLPLRSADGRRIEVEFVSNVYQVDHLRVIQCNIRDITEQKKIDKMRTEFVSIASHELRTPLSNITEAVAQVTDGIYGEISPEQRTVLGIAHRNCERLGRLVHDLLDISRIESGKSVFHRTFVDMGSLVRKLCDMYQVVAGKKGLTLRHDVGGGTPLAFGDADRLEQVLLNLIGNAITYTPSGGKITVAAGLDGSHIRCAVSDTGIGIAPEYLHTVFDKFMTIASAAHGGGSGTGLGLAITRQLVQLHGGEIWVESEPEKGSRFVFTIPDYQSEAGLMESLTRRVAKAGASHTGISLLGIRPQERPELQAEQRDGATPFLHTLRDALAEGLGASVNIWSLEDARELVIVSDDREEDAAGIRQAVLHQHGKSRFSINKIPIQIGLQLATACYPGDAADANQLRAVLRDRFCQAPPFVNAPT